MGIKCASLVRLGLRQCLACLLPYPVYLANSGNPRYPGVRLWVVIGVLLTEKDVNLLIVRVVLALHPGCRDERGIWEEEEEEKDMPD